MAKNLEQVAPDALAEFISGCVSHGSDEVHLYYTVYCANFYASTGQSKAQKFKTGR